MQELTRSQIEQQDRIDNVIYRLLLELVSDTIPWNIEEIGAIRDEVLPIVARHTDKTEEELYPGFDCED